MFESAGATSGGPFLRSVIADACHAFAELRRQQSAAVEEALAADRITAPFAGRVARVSEAGVRAAPGATVVELWDDEVLRVEAELWQHQVANN